jgi:hypothetical protein
MRPSTAICCDARQILNSRVGKASHTCTSIYSFPNPFTSATMCNASLRVLFLTIDPVRFQAPSMENSYSSFPQDSFVVLKRATVSFYDPPACVSRIRDPGYHVSRPDCSLWFLEHSLRCMLRSMTYTLLLQRHRAMYKPRNTKQDNVHTNLSFDRISSTKVSIERQP